jgi:hypothetical protein
MVGMGQKVRSSDASSFTDTIFKLKISVVHSDFRIDIGFLCWR